MALITLDFESEYMGSNQNVNIIVPDKPRDISFYGFYMEHLADILTGSVKAILRHMRVKRILL